MPELSASYVFNERKAGFAPVASIVGITLELQMSVIGA
jgi:hypothetical protein